MQQSKQFGIEFMSIQAHESTQSIGITEPSKERCTDAGYSDHSCKEANFLTDQPVGITAAIQFFLMLQYGDSH